MINLYLVFTIPNCPKCGEIKRKLDFLKIDYKEIAVMDSEENKQLAIKYKIKSGGTVIDDETGSVINV